MTADLGLRATEGDLIVQTGGDFVWSYTWTVDGVATDYPAGSTLDLMVGEDGVADVYPFVIVGDTGDVQIDVAVADTIEEGTPFRLRFIESGIPTILVHGLVKRDDPRGLT